MNKKKIIIVILIGLLLVGVLYFVYPCICNTKHNISNTQMVTFAEKHLQLLPEIGIQSINYRFGNDYYICQYTDSSLYLVGSDLKVIRDITNGNKILSTNAKTDQALSANIIVLMSIVEEMVVHNICEVLLNGNTIFIKRFDDYCLTNEVKNNQNEWQEIETNWYILLP